MSPWLVHQQMVGRREKKNLHSFEASSQQAAFEDGSVKGPQIKSRDRRAIEKQDNAGFSRDLNLFIGGFISNNRRLNKEIMQREVGRHNA